MSSLVVYAMIARPSMDEDSREITPFSRLAHDELVVEVLCCLGLGVFSAQWAISAQSEKTHTAFTAEDLLQLTGMQISLSPLVF